MMNVPIDSWNVSTAGSDILLIWCKAPTFLVWWKVLESRHEVVDEIFQGNHHEHATNQPVIVIARINRCFLEGIGSKIDDERSPASLLFKEP